jgi:hypothetical protein
MNNNPTGINQYTKGGGGNAQKKLQRIMRKMKTGAAPQRNASAYAAALTRYTNHLKKK